MPEKDELIARIVATEWRMFQDVQNEGGTAACQEDPQTFEIMRAAQAQGWSEAALASYLSDLERAEADGRNLMTEKYARMMQSTAPEEYAEMQHLLPPLDPAITPLIDSILQIVLAWEEELATQYPYLLQRGRPLRSSQDSPAATSLETYLRGELSTFSLKTIQLYLEHVQSLASQHINGSAITLESTIRRYGFQSLMQANDQIKAQSLG